MSYLRPLTKLVPKTTKKILGKKGLLFGKMVMDWSHIVGEDIAQKATPLELKFSRNRQHNNRATLQIATTSAYAPEIQAQIPQLKERLNSFFGYNAITDIKLIHTSQKVIEKKFVSPILPELNRLEKNKVAEKVGNIERDDLKNALKSLGESIIARQKLK